MVIGVVLSGSGVKMQIKASVNGNGGSKNMTKKEWVIHLLIASTVTFAIIMSLPVMLGLELETLYILEGICAIIIGNLIVVGVYWMGKKKERR